MEVLIRPGKIEDVPQALNLIKELALFEKEPNEVVTTIASMEQDGFGNNPSYMLTVAVLNETIVGIAVYFIKYSTWKGKGVYLDDIVVTESLRGKGIGKLLFDHVINYAKSIDAKQMHWQVLEWNEPAIAFYKKYDTSFDKGWINCKLSF
jgi:GNAT superfamily N-acetyltransferase